MLAGGNGTFMGFMSAPVQIYDITTTAKQNYTTKQQSVIAQVLGFIRLYSSPSSQSLKSQISSSFVVFP